ncbi:LacI family DNA-binding transcriptional regulator [Aliikangiella sp. G2MR2-5]|uniref:LacI family DNA-binding transcriptional regulator n=1 Tax=Aliikangiella sp. G2MR2-5 TaxID=2788943 RepID=UPI0018AB91AF|nr:LacI family DNA-binding transcriptional regulator [Aliikangiella sp. G2MR2-5]
MSVTINDVAKHAGVSMKTVSRVINNESSVRQSTYDKVMASVKALNYRPNNSARSLAGTRSYTIGFIYDNPNAYYVIDMQNGLLSQCRENNYELLIHPCNHQADDLEEELTHLINHSRVAGLVLTPPFSEMPKVSRMLEKMALPYVRIISGLEKGKQAASCIFVNDHEAAYNITQHLIDLGHKQIGFLCGGEEHRSSSERLNGYLAALSDNHVKTSKQWVVEGEYSFDSGVKGAKKLLGRKKKPTAIFASNDEMAAGALFAARLMGISIPDELSIVGFEDSPFSRQTWPKLTTAHQPNQVIAQQAANLLISKIQGQSCEQLEEGNMIRSFSPELVVRDSTGCAPK